MPLLPCRVFALGLLAAPETAFAVEAGGDALRLRRPAAAPDPDVSVIRLHLQP